MKEKIEKKHFPPSDMNVVLVGDDKSKINCTANLADCNLIGIELSISSSRGFWMNEKKFTVIAKYEQEKLDSIIAEADAILYIDANEEQITHCEQLREINPDCIAIDFAQTGFGFKECLAKIENLKDHAKSSKLQCKALDNYKTELFLFGNRVDENSYLKILPTEVAQIIALGHVFNCNYSSLSFFKKMPEQKSVDQSSTLLLNI